MTTTEIAAIRQLATTLCRQNTTWRAGQCWFNALNTLHPEIANQVRGGDLDPYYDNRRIIVFLDFLEHYEPTN